MCNGSGREALPQVTQYSLIAVLYIACYISVSKQFLFPSTVCDFRTWSTLASSSCICPLHHNHASLKYATWCVFFSNAASIRPSSCTFAYVSPKVASICGASSGRTEIVDSTKHLHWDVAQQKTYCSTRVSNMVGSDLLLHVWRYWCWCDTGPFRKRSTSECYTLVRALRSACNAQLHASALRVIGWAVFLRISLHLNPVCAQWCGPYGPR